MRLHGYCQKCRRIKPVKVDRYIGKGTPTGICMTCEVAMEAENKRRIEERRRRT